MHPIDINNGHPYIKIIEVLQCAASITSLGGKKKASAESSYSNKLITAYE